RLLIRGSPVVLGGCAAGAQKRDGDQRDRTAKLGPPDDSAHQMFECIHHGPLPRLPQIRSVFFHIRFAAIAGAPGDLSLRILTESVRIAHTAGSPMTAGPFAARIGTRCGAAEMQPPSAPWVLTER